MKRFGQTALWAGLVLVLGVGTAPAQLNEIIRGAANGVQSDLFNCRFGVLSCDLGYRMYSETDSDEVNGPANPVDGNPAYRSGPNRYLTDSQTTANFPVSKSVQNANWYMAWDGVTDSGTSAHAGWYGMQSQKIKSGELGNATSFNCLPVVSLEACWLALARRNGFNDTVRDDGSPLLHEGGLSPVPCPQLTENGLTDITYSWEGAANHTEADSAPSGIVGTSLYMLGNPTAAPTDLDWAAGGVAVSSESGTATSTTVSRGTVDGLLGGASTYVASLKLDYASTSGKAAKLSNFSCNSGFSGACLFGTTEPGDAPANVDVEEICLEVRTEDGVRYLVVSFHMATANVKVNQIRYGLTFDGNNNKQAELIGFPAPASRNKADTGVLLHANASFDAGDIVGNSTFDDVNGVVEMVVNLDNLELDMGPSAVIDAQVRLPGPNRDDVAVGSVTWADLE